VTPTLVLSRPGAVSALALAAQPVALAVEPVRIGWQDREVACVDVGAVQIRRRRDAEVRVGRVAVARRRLTCAMLSSGLQLALRSAASWEDGGRLAAA
jgi:hypothetical protein